MKYQPGRPTHVHTRCGRMCALSYGIIDAYATSIHLHASAGIFSDTCIADILEVNKTKTTRATSLQLELLYIDLWMHKIAFCNVAASL